MSKTAEQELRAQFWAFYKEEDIKYGEDYHDAGDVRILCERALERFVASLRSKELQERVEIWIDTAKKQGERIYELEERLRLIKGECNRPDDEPCNITYIEMQADKALSGEATKGKDETVNLKAEVISLQSVIDELRKENEGKLEAYNRECKRVDELTEELNKKKLRIQELEKWIAFH